MNDRREEILATKVHSIEYPHYLLDSEAIDAMDQYMQESCLALLQYMADNNITLSLASIPQDPLFTCKGELLTKEQVFENFL